MARFQACDTPFKTILARYLVPLAKEAPAEIAMNAIIANDAAKLEFIPVTRRAGPAWDKYNSRSSRSKRQWEILRIVCLGMVLVVIYTLLKRNE